MEDIAPKLLKNVEKEFTKRFKKSNVVSILYQQIKSGSASYKDANDFAIELGELLSETFQSVLSSDVLPDGKMYYNIAKRVLSGPLENNHNLVSEVCANVQTQINKKAGIGIKAIKPKVNKDRINGIIDIVSGKDNFDKIAYMLNEPVVNFTQSVVDESVKVNADFQYKAGLNPKIKRTSTSQCCEWCGKLAGTYDYEKIKDQGNDVFRRHKECRCLVEYIVGDKHKIVSERKSNSDKKQKRIKKAQKLSERNLEKMRLPELRKLAEETALEYYKSGKSGISFGETDPKNVAKQLAMFGSRTSLKKDIRSMRKKLNESVEKNGGSGKLDIEKGSNQYLQKQLQYVQDGEKSFIPKGTKFVDTKVIAGLGSDTKLRVSDRLAEKYGDKSGNWSKIAGKIESDRYVFDVHWYEASNSNMQYEPKLKTRRDKL